MSTSDEASEHPESLLEIPIPTLREIYDVPLEQQAAVARTHFHELIEALEDGRLLRLWRFACLAAQLGPVRRLSE